MTEATKCMEMKALAPIVGERTSFLKIVDLRMGHTPVLPICGVMTAIGRRNGDIPETDYWNLRLRLALIRGSKK
jgi:hypothetical protein